MHVKCSKGHGMSIINKSPYNDKHFCDKCEKHIVLQEGFYHCTIDEEDYHRDCKDEEYDIPDIPDIEEEEEKLPEISNQNSQYINDK